MPVFFDVPDVHRDLVLDLLKQARAFLQLKDCNSVRMLFTCELDPMHGQPSHAHPSPILVRVRISNVQAGNTVRNPFCEFRIASAEEFETAARVDFDYVHESIIKFFDTQFAADHWYHISKMTARMVMREPLGVLAVMEGTSVLFGRRRDETIALRFVADDASLSEV